MIDLTSLYVRGFLEDVKQRVAATSEALSWAEGEPVYRSKDLVPTFTKGSEAEEAFVRYVKQLQNLGPRALRLRRQGAIGSVTWSSVPDETNGLLDALPLRRLARDGYKDVFVNGVAALWPVARRAVGEGAAPRPTIQRLGGHLEILWDEDDVGGTPVGLYQVTGSSATYKGAGLRYDVRIYDFTDGVLRIWRALEAPGFLADDPDEIYPEPGSGQTLLMPTIAYGDVSQDGYPVGELKTALPLLRQEVSHTLRILRTSDAHAYPIWNLVGKYEEPRRIGSNTVFRSNDPSSRAERVQPADLTTLFEDQDRAADRIRTDLLLPITTSGEIPSGEALIQANASYNNASEDGAEIIGELLTGAVRGYFELLGGQLPAGFVVNVKPDRELKRSTIAMQVREDFRAGIVNREIALNELIDFYPSASTETVEAWLSEDDDPVPPAPPSSPADFADDDE